MKLIKPQAYSVNSEALRPEALFVCLYEVKTQGFIACRSNTLVAHLLCELADTAWLSLAFVGARWRVGWVSEGSHRLQELEPLRVHKFINNKMHY